LTIENKQANNRKTVIQFYTSLQS